MTNFFVQHNTPFSIADDLRPLFLNIFPGSQIAKEYASARTKATCILNNAIASHFTSMHSATSPLGLLPLRLNCTLQFTVSALLVEAMKEKSFSLLIVGSNDTNIEKLNPLKVRIYDDKQKQVVPILLDMCTTSGRDCSTADINFQKIDSIMSQYDISWG